MPFYDLQCQDCQSEYKEMVPFSKLPTVKCPKCGSTEKEQLFKANVKGPIKSGSGHSGNSGFT